MKVINNMVIHIVNTISMRCKYKSLLIRLTLGIVTMVLGSSPAESAINWNTPFKFFEKSKVIENIDSTFTTISSYADVIPLEKAYCGLDSLILTDIISAAYYWESQGKPIRSTPHWSLGRLPAVVINIGNLPYNDRVQLSPVHEAIGRQFEGIIIRETPEGVLRRGKYSKYLKQGIDLVDIDYAIRGDSLITTVYRCRYKENRTKSEKTVYEYINFIRRLDCSDDRWKLVSINDEIDYFPEAYGYDYLREAIANDLDYYLSFNYRYNRWRNKLWIEKHGSYNEDEDDDDDDDDSYDDNCGYKYKKDDIKAHSNGEYSFADYCKKMYLVSRTFPIGMSEYLRLPVNMLPRDYYHRSDYAKLSKEIFRRYKTETTLELKIVGNTLIIHFNTDSVVYCPKQKSTVATSSKFGFFVHQYDCETHQWKRIGEYIYAY